MGKYGYKQLSSGPAPVVRDYGDPIPWTDPSLSGPGSELYTCLSTPSPGGGWRRGGTYCRWRLWVQMDQSPRSRAAVIGREDVRWRFSQLSSNCCKTSEGTLRLPTRDCGTWITGVSMGSVSSITPLSGFKEALRCPWKRGVILSTPLSGINEGLSCPWKRGQIPKNLTFEIDIIFSRNPHTSYPQMSEGRNVTVVEIASVR